MVVLLAALALTATLNSTPPVEPLPSRPLAIEPFVIPANHFVNFDLLDARAELSEPPARAEVQPHTVFGIKRHIGVGAGYDSGILHGSIGLYLTIAEMGRWNFGIPSPAVGFGRAREYDSKEKRAVTKTQATILVSLVSIHYRGGYINSLGMNWYVNLEQVFDSRANLTESQFGFSFSRK
jgi:hypothetical protein